MSVYVIPEHQTSYFTCDFIGGKPEHRSACSAGVSVRADQGALAHPFHRGPPRRMGPLRWRAPVPDHADRVPKDGHVAALVWAGLGKDAVVSTAVLCCAAVELVFDIWQG